MNLRIAKILAKLKEKNLDGLLVSSASNISYLTKFKSRDSYFLVSPKENIYFTDSRYIEEVKELLKTKATLVKINGSIFKLVADACLNLGLGRIGFEERNLSFAEHKKIKEELGDSGDLIPIAGLIEGLRQIKEPQELEKIRKAIQITKIALEFIEAFILPGKKEIEVVAELERFIRYNAGMGSSFEIIVASGQNSSLPHHVSGQRRIKKDESVLVDLGVDYQGYKSDLTRVYFLSKIKVHPRKIYEIVLEAQGKAIKKIKPAVKIGEIDRAARGHISEKGYGAFFGHNLGHGVGLDVHEEPHISRKEENILRPGMVFTIEPGIYLPGKFGIRIEDMVLVTEKGCEVLSGALHK